jgi:hypothetical protein
MKPPDKVFLASTAVIALSTATFPHIRGYGTMLYEGVVLSGWSILARASSGLYADQHHGILWPLILLVNLFAFLMVATPIWAILRNRAPRFAALGTICWMIFYVAMLFVLFPATDGP